MSDARSFTIAVKNWSGSAWSAGQDYIQMSHGRSESIVMAGGHVAGGTTPQVFAYDPNEPWPDHNHTVWRFVSDGIGTGVEGWMTLVRDYDPANGQLVIHFNNPFAGGNEFSAQAPDGFTLSWGDPGGDNASIFLRIDPVPVPPPAPAPTGNLVPAVTAMSPADATAVLNGAGFEVASRLGVSHEQDIGIVIMQTPEAGSLLEPPGPVTIIVGGGPPPEPENPEPPQVVCE